MSHTTDTTHGPLYVAGQDEARLMILALDAFTRTLHDADPDYHLAREIRQQVTEARAGEAVLQVRGCH